jgi:amino acid permease
MSKALPLWKVSNVVGTDNNEDTDDEDSLNSINYVLYAAIFAMAVIPLSCLELSEQITVQVSMTLCRFIMVYLMVTTCEDVVVDYDNQLAPLVSWSGLPYMVPICVFAHIFHHSIPGLAHPVQKKKQLGSIFRFTVIFCTLAYSLLGWRLGTVFGMATEQSVNINWSTYHPEHSPHWLARAISMYVICFPALDVLSAFPLNAITLGNNLLGAAYGKDVHTAEVSRYRQPHLLCYNCIHLTVVVLLVIW